MKVVKTAKKKHWREYCDSIGQKKKSVQEVWKTIKRMSGNRKEFGYPVLKEGQNVIVENKCNSISI